MHQKMQTAAGAGAPSHLLILYVVSAGKNGEELGTDEKQVVSLVHTLYDITNNKVVTLQSHYVKPQQDDLSETILTDECKEETGLDENKVKNALPLEVVLEEVDRFLLAKGVHPDRGGNSFVLLTDGQCHLRQCIHNEISVKNSNCMPPKESFTLPSYYYKFYDIRKEFKKRYEADTVEGVKSMLDYLGLEEDQSVEYGTRQCQDMAKIINRLINDGHTFGEPEVINERLEGGICTKNEVVDDNSVVRARGLPWQSSDQDIARFFKGLNIAKGGVALCLSPQGRRNGEALIRFENEEQRDLALKRHKHHIGQRYIEVYKASGKDFINVAGGSNAEAQQFLSRGGQTIIRMRGLPFAASAAQVLEFFTREPSACQVLDGEEGILFVHYPDGRATGDAFVLFANEEESQKALKKHKDCMGSRYIELFKSTTAEVQQVLNRSMDPRNPEQHQQDLTTTLITLPPTAMQLMPQNFITHGSTRDCLRMTQLPMTAQVTDILQFMGEFAAKIAFQGVHMVFTAQGEPSGEAFIQMQDAVSAENTSRFKHGQLMSHRGKKHPIGLLQVSGDEMSMILANYSMPALPPPGMTTMISQVSPMSLPMVTMSSMPVASPVSPLTVGSITSMGQIPMTLQPAQRHIQITPNGVHGYPPGPLTTTTLQLASPGMPHLGTMQMTQIPQPIQAAAFPPAMASMAQRPAFYPPMLYW